MAYRNEGPPARGGGRNPGTRTSIKPPNSGPKNPPSGPTGVPTNPHGATKPKPKKSELQLLLDSIYGPGQNALLSEIQTQRETAARQAADARAKAEAYSKWYSEHVPQQIQGIYSSAAGQEGYLAKGFSDGMQIAQDQQASEANQRLANIGAPEGQQLHPTHDAADVLFGVGGYIPASTLGQQGAAFGAAAALMPGAILGMGLKSAEKILADAEEVIIKLEGELAKLETKRGETGLKISEARRAERLKAAIEDRKFKLAVRKQNFSEYLASKKYNFDVTQAGIENTLDQKKYELSVWKANHPLLQTVGNQKMGYYSFDPRTGKMGATPLIPGTGEPLKIFGSATAGYYGYDPNTKTIVQLRPGTGTKKKVTQKMITDGWKTIRQGQKGHWALQADPDSPLSTSDLSDIRDKLQDGSLGVKLTWQEFLSLPEDQAIQLEDKLGIQYTTGDPWEIYHSLVQSGIPPKRSMQMVARYFPKWAKTYTVEIPPGWTPDLSTVPGKVDAAYSGGVPAGITPSKYQPTAIAAANKYGIPTGIFLSMIQAESGWDPNAGSSAGAIGIAQFMPGTAKGLGINPRDPIASLNAAAKHLKALYRNLGSWELALAGYNAGAGAVKKYGGIPPYAETQAYVKKIMRMAATGGGASGNVSYNTTGGGAWEGSLAVANQGKRIAQQYGLSASGKRSKKLTSSGHPSDHWTGSKNAFAYDLSGSKANMDQAAMALAQSLGIAWDGRSELIEDVYVGPFRIQIIYNTPKYGGHLDHIHFGVRRVRGGGSYA